MRTPERYCRLIESGGSVEAAGETLDPGLRDWEELVLSLRTSAGVPSAAAPEELYDAGLVQLQTGGATAVLTPRGRLLANEVAIKLLRPVFHQ